MQIVHSVCFVNATKQVLGFIFTSLLHYQRKKMGLSICFECVNSFRDCNWQITVSGRFSTTYPTISIVFFHKLAIVVVVKRWVALHPFLFTKLMVLSFCTVHSSIHNLRKNNNSNHLQHNVTQRIMQHRAQDFTCVGVSHAVVSDVWKFIWRKWNCKLWNSKVSFCVIYDSFVILPY